MPRVLITGAAGFIGMHTSIRFLEEGWDVIGLDNMNDYYSVQLKHDRLKEIKKAEERFSAGNFKLYENDLNSNVWANLEGDNIQVVIHLAAQAGVRYSLKNPQAYLESNILGFQRVLEFVVQQEINSFFYASSSSVYGNTGNRRLNELSPINSPESYYAATKIANELMAHSYLKTHNLASVGLRFFTVYGPWGRPDMAPWIFANAAINSDAIKVFNYGKQARDFTYVGDVVDRVFRLVSMHEESVKLPKVLNIGNGKPVELIQFIETIEKHMDSQMQKKFVEKQKGDVCYTNASTDLMQKVLGDNYKITSLEDGIKEFCQWFKSYVNRVK